MDEKRIVKPGQTSAQESPWPTGDRLRRLLWELAWFVFCEWTPKPFNPWRLFWLRLFDAKIQGMPFVHQRARIAIPWNLTIGEEAFIGARAFVMPGVTIGARSIIGACSVVTKDVAADTIAAGNPCRALRPCA